jgi:predicted nucleic acid-binding protein
VLLVLDSGSLGLLSKPNGLWRAESNPRVAFEQLNEGAGIVVPEIADYEVRRELLRADLRDGLRRLDEPRRSFLYEPLRTAHFRRAAELWAEARNRGLPAAHDAALDGDVLLAAQALALASGDRDTVVITSNPKHLAGMVRASRWREV